MNPVILVILIIIVFYRVADMYVRYAALTSDMVLDMSPIISNYMRIQGAKLWKPGSGEGSYDIRIHCPTSGLSGSWHVN